MSWVMSPPTRKPVPMEEGVMPCGHIVDLAFVVGVVVSQEVRLGIIHELLWPHTGEAQSVLVHVLVHRALLDVAIKEDTWDPHTWTRG